MGGFWRKFRMLWGLTFLLVGGLLVVWTMALLEPFAPQAGTTFSNCWWYGVVRYWKEGGAVIMHQSRYTAISHVAWTADLVTFYAFDPPLKRRRFLPPPLFTGRITEMGVVAMQRQIAAGPLAPVQ